MKKDLNSRRPSGSEKKNEPKVIGEVLIEYFQSEEPLAVAYRKWKAKTAEAKDAPDNLFIDIYPHTELDVDLKLLTRKRGRMPVGTHLNGVLTHDGEDHFRFIENASEKKMPTTRNPRIYKGSCINLIRSNDGSLRPTFNRPKYSKNFNFQDFCREAAEELRVVADLIGE